MIGYMNVNEYRFVGKIIKTLAAVLVTLARTSGHITCLSCKDIVHARDCTTIERCGASSSCYIDGYITQLGFLRFNLGCRDLLQCRSDNTTSSKTEDGEEDTQFCSNCCTGDLCNSAGCREQGYLSPASRGPICYNCPNQLSTSDCQAITVCRSDDVCMLRRILFGPNSEIRYETKCEYKRKCHAEVDFYVRPSAVGRKRKSEEFQIGNTCMIQCCDTDLCNLGCSNTSTSTSSTSVTPPIVKKPSVEILTAGQEKIFAQLGAPLTLACQSTSLPVPDITWSFVKNVGSTTVINNNTLSFTSLQPSQLGNYTCTARNVYGTSSKTVTVISNVTAAVDCTFDQLDACLWTNNRLDNGEWVNSGEPSLKTAVVALDPTLKNLTGNYLYTPVDGAQTDRVVDLVSPELGPAGPACLAFLYHLDRDAGDQIHVEVIASCDGYKVCNGSLPKTVILHGASNRSVSWTLAQIRLPAISHDHKLVIRFIHSVPGTRRGYSAIDSIKYTDADCKPSLTSTGRPDIDVVVAAGSVLQLTCGVYGFPTPVYSWSKQGGCGSFDNVTGRSVLISGHASAGDAGTYICISSNGGPDMTSSSQVFHVSVNGDTQAVCTFEHGLCGWTQDDDDDYDWSTNNGSTPSKDTGPSADHTMANGTGKYLFLESSSPAQTGDQVRLRSVRMAGNQSACFSLYYHMLGSDIGQLTVSIKDTCSSHRTKLFTTSGNRGDKWLFQSVDIPLALVPRDYYIEISASVGPSYHGDIAIDDLMIKNASCS